MSAIQFNTATFDNKHLRSLATRRKRLQALYNAFYKQVAVIGTTTGFNDPDKEFYLRDYPAAQLAIKALLQQLTRDITTNIKDGNEAAWGVSEAKNSNLIAALGLKKSIADTLLANVTKRSESAFNAFQSRKVDGLGLSERVWALNKGFMPQIEMALELGLSQGKSAAALSRDVRQYLNEPNRLFRRVRGKDGILRLSKAAKAYHPSRGVYRSSYKNALRLTATEINMAYRSADHAQWGEMDFVLGIEISLSNNHPVVDICDELKGVYPKDFKFVGWHPFCRCFATPVLPTREQLNKWAQMSDAERAGYNWDGVIKDVPNNFMGWIAQNRERAKGWGSAPYFIRDNKHYVDDFRVNVYTEAEKIFTRYGRTKEAMRVALDEELKQKYPDLKNTEIAAIYHYTQKYGSSFRHLNKSIRDGRPLDKFEEAFSELLSSGLNKLPAYEGEVYRGFSISKTGVVELCERANAGESVSLGGFASCSKKLEIADSFILGEKGYSVIMHIKSKTGKALGDLSMFNGKRGTANQYEVLFDKGTKIAIKKYSADGKIIHIYADEI